MQFFYWNKSFEVGIAEIDSQHRGLVDLINALASAVVEGGKLPEAKTLLDQLLGYAAQHFSNEEQIMATAPLSLEEKTRHQQEHHSFAKKVKTIVLRSDLMQGEVSQQVLEFLTTWLISHILGSDMRIAKALTRKGADSGQKGERLFEISPVERLLLEALTETERRFRLIADQTSVLIWVSDSTGNRGFFNRAWNDFVGVQKKSSHEFDWQRYIHPEDLAAYREKLAAVLSDPKPAEFEYRLLSHDGNYHWILERILPRIDFNDALLGLLASSTDISGIKQAEALVSKSSLDLEKEVAYRTEKLEQLMLTDPLTGIGNRRQLSKRLEEEVIRAERYLRPLTVAFFDIDHFKRVNDTYGHNVGDLVLASTAQSLGSRLRGCDLLCRFGGEEFVVLLPETDKEQAIKVAERMRLDIASMRVGQVEQTITISAGLAQWQPGESGDQILERCDQALYMAKASGRNCCRMAD